MWVWQVKHGVCFTPQQRERGVRRHRYDTIAEGIGLDRLTANFQQARCVSMHINMITLHVTYLRMYISRYI